MVCATILVDYLSIVICRTGARQSGMSMDGAVDRCPSSIGATCSGCSALLHRSPWTYGIPRACPSHWLIAAKHVMA